MKTVQKYWVLSLFMVAGLIFAGCGDTAGGGGDAGGSSDTTETSGGSGDKEDGSADKDDNASTQASGEFQLVSLKVPHMT